MIQFIAVLALLGGCGCGDGGGGSGYTSGGCSSCGAVSTVQGCSSCGEVTDNGCSSCGSQTYSTGYCGSCERYGEGIPILSEPEYTYQGYTELKSFSTCTAKLQCGQNYCYAQVPVVNGCLPKLHVSRRKDGCITGFTCDYSGKTPYRGGCPTYSRKRKVVRLPVAPAPTTVPVPKEEPTPADPPTTVPVPQEEPTPSIMSNPKTPAGEPTPAQGPAPATNTEPELSTPQRAPTTVPVPLPDPDPTTVPVPRSDSTTTINPITTVPTPDSDASLLSTDTPDPAATPDLCDCDLCDCECECDCECDCCCGEHLGDVVSDEVRSDVGVMAGTVMFPHESFSSAYTYPTPQVSHEYPSRSGFSGGGWGWGGGGGGSGGGSTPNPPTPVVPEPSTFFLWIISLFCFCLWIAKKAWTRYGAQICFSRTK